MKFIQSIKQTFKGKPKDPSEIWKDTQGVIKFAFRTPSGRDYYCYEDMSNKPFKRALQAITFYNELEENCSKDVMKEFHAAIQAVLDSKEIKMAELFKINAILGERLYKLPPAPSLILRLASVVFFDKSENPTTYDFKYNMEKISRWEKEYPEGAFFLTMPIKALLPSLNVSPENLKSYLEVWEGVENTPLQNLLSQGYAKVSNYAKNKTGVS